MSKNQTITDKDIKDSPRRARKAIKKLHKLVDYLEFYMGKDSDGFRNHVVKDLAGGIEDVLHQLSIEKNIDHIRLATKLKTIWKKEQNKKIDGIVEKIIEAEVEQRLDDIMGRDDGDM